MACLKLRKICELDLVMFGLKRTIKLRALQGKPGRGDEEQRVTVYRDDDDDGGLKRRTEEGHEFL